MSNTYTIKELTAMPDADLNALAARLRGWKLREPSDPTSGSFLNWVDSDGVEQYSRRGWQPATNRNQSGELLEWAAAHGVAVQVNFGEIPFIEITWPDAPENLHSLNGASWTEIPGNTARSETVAFCAAMLAMAGRLK